MNLIKHPATCIVHWPTGPVYQCDTHARALMNLAKMFSYDVVAVPITPCEIECKNCISEEQSIK